MEPLVKLALVGTGRTAEPAASGSPVADLVGRAGIAEPERALLLAAGAWAVWRLAGWQPPLLPEPPAPAPEKSKPSCTPRVAEILEQVIDGAYRVLLPETCALLAAAGRRLPHALLPAALSLPKPYRAAVRPVLGERGRWLAAQEPAWAWAADAAPVLDDEEGVPADAEHLWEEGSFDAREALLARVRRADPARARGWLEAGLAREKAERRAAFLEKLAVGLGPEDEPLLERALDDRSQQVRAAAGLLLARLPGSAYAARMRERADPLLSWEAPKSGGLLGKVGALLGGKARGRLLVEPPQAVDKSWERDGIPAAPPQGVGARAFWLAHVLARVPPRHWEGRFGTTPAELLAAARETDWLGALVDGWARAALASGAGGWAGALWDFVQEHEKDREAPAELRPLLPELLAAVPEAEREERIARLLDAPPAAAEAPLELFLRQLPRPWRPAFAARYLDRARSAADETAQGGRRTPVDPWLATLPLAAVALPPESFDAALAPWPTDRIETPDWWQRSWMEKIQEMTDALHVRRTLRKEIVP